jgi:hypothetical protein
MLQMLRDRVEEKGLTNVELVLAGLGEGRLAANEFDIALLVTVLGGSRGCGFFISDTVNMLASASINRPRITCVLRDHGILNVGKV